MSETGDEMDNEIKHTSKVFDDGRDLPSNSGVQKISMGDDVVFDATAMGCTTLAQAERAAKWGMENLSYITKPQAAAYGDAALLRIALDDATALIDRLEGLVKTLNEPLDDDSVMQCDACGEVRTVLHMKFCDQITQTLAAVKEWRGGNR